MVDWIRADDKSRDWPEGEVVALSQFKGSYWTDIMWRDFEGDFLSDESAGKFVTHYFYLPPKPAE